MPVYFVLFLINSFLIYQSLTGIGIIGLKHISLIDPNNIYIQILKIALVKWGIPLGIAGVLFSLAGIAVLYKDDNYDNFRNGLLVFYILVAFLSIV